MGGGSSVAYPLKEKTPLNGMFKSINEMFPNLSEAVEVSVSSTSVRCMTKPEQVIQGPYDGEWSSENQTNSWYQVHLLNRKADIYGYTIKTYDGDKNTTHMKSWKIEVSENGFDWRLLDSVENCEILNSPNAIFSKHVAPIGAHTYVRITMTDKNWFGTNCMTLSNFEIFGNLL